MSTDPSSSPASCHLSRLWAAGPTSPGGCQSRQCKSCSHAADTRGHRRNPGEPPRTQCRRWSSSRHAPPASAPCRALGCSPNIMLEPSACWHDHQHVASKQANKHL
eukprot:146610-Pelagomonas_calceolata.AAC.4